MQESRVPVTFFFAPVLPNCDHPPQHLRNYERITFYVNFNHTARYNSTKYKAI